MGGIGWMQALTVFCWVPQQVACSELAQSPEISVFWSFIGISLMALGKSFASLGLSYHLSFSRGLDELVPVPSCTLPLVTVGTPGGQWEHELCPVEPDTCRASTELPRGLCPPWPEHTHPTPAFPECLLCA